MRSLLWKEWHEQWWKLAFGSLILAAFAAIGLHARAVPDSETLEWLAVLAALLLPIMASTGLVPPERDDGTLDTLLALPVPVSKIFLVKLAFGLLLCVGPILAATLASIATAGGREVALSEMITLSLRTAGVTLSLFIWMFTLTIRLPSETRAAMITIGVLIIWTLASAGMGIERHDAAATSSLWIISPFVYLFGPTTGDKFFLPLTLTVQTIIALALCYWAMCQLDASKESRS